MLSVSDTMRVEFAPGGGPMEIRVLHFMQAAPPAQPR